MLEELAEQRCRRARFLRRPGRRGLARAARPHLRDHACRHLADAEKAALAFRQHLELDVALLEPGEVLLELAESGPLRLTDRLSGRLGALGRGDRKSVV